MVCRQHDVVFMLVKRGINVLLQLIKFFILNILQVRIYYQRILLHLVFVCRYRVWVVRAVAIYVDIGTLE